jgi:hypothetical protein
MWGVLTISGYDRQQLRQQHRRIAAADDERKRRRHPRSQTPTNGAELRKQSLKTEV